MIALHFIWMRAGRRSGARRGRSARPPGRLGGDQQPPVIALPAVPDQGVEQVIFFQAEDGIRDYKVTGQTCALPIWPGASWACIMSGAQKSGTWGGLPVPMK